MANIRTNVHDVKTARGEKMKTGKGYRLITPTGRGFKATLVRRIKIGKEDVAILRIITSPKDA